MKTGELRAREEAKSGSRVKGLDNAIVALLGIETVIFVGWSTAFKLVN